MAVNLIEFKLHAGRIPYFIKDYIGGVTTSTGRNYGISQDDVNCYLPTEVVALTSEQFIAAIVAEDIKKATAEFPPTLESMTTEEKTTFATDWLTARGF